MKYIIRIKPLQKILYCRYQNRKAKSGSADYGRVGFLNVFQTVANTAGICYNIGKALASLENKACVVRMQDEADKRIKRLSLTDVGREKVAELVDIHNNWLHDIMTCLSSKEQKQFENYCKRLLAAAEKLTNNGGAQQ